MSLKAYKVVGYDEALDEGYSLTNQDVSYDITVGSVWKSSIGFVLSASARNAKHKTAEAPDDKVLLVFHVRNHDAIHGDWITGGTVKAHKAQLVKVVHL
jgi:hypothetical protein